MGFLRNTKWFLDSKYIGWGNSPLLLPQRTRKCFWETLDHYVETQEHVRASFLSRWGWLMVVSETWSGKMVSSTFDLTRWLSDSLAPLLIFWALSHFRGSDSDVSNGVSCFSLIVAPTLCLRGNTLDVKDSFTRQAGSWNCPWEQKKTGLCGERFSSAWLRSFFGQRKLRRAARWWRRQLENKTASILCNEITRPKFYFVILTAFVYPWLGSR